MPTVRAPGAGGVLILGASGMLGHALMHELSASLPDTSVRGTVRSLDSLPSDFRSAYSSQLVDGVDVLDAETVPSLIEKLQPDVVVNAVGVIKQAPGVEDHVLTTKINALLPHVVAQSCSAIGSRLIQISTDCVFSGRTGNYTEQDVPDPVDFYGRSKLLGEVAAPHITLRTSIIGPELRNGASLLEWFLSQDGSRISGYTKAIYSGLPTVELARVIASMVLPRPDLEGLWHVSGQAISKYELLNLIASAYGWQGRIDPFDGFSCDRSMSSQRLTEATGYVAPSWPTLVQEMRVAHHRWLGD